MGLLADLAGRAEGYHRGADTPIVLRFDAQAGVAARWMIGLDGRQ